MILNPYLYHSVVYTSLYPVGIYTDSIWSCNHARKALVAVALLSAAGARQFAHLRSGQRLKDRADEF